MQITENQVLFLFGDQVASYTHLRSPAGSEISPSEATPFFYVYANREFCDVALTQKIVKALKSKH